MKKILGGIASVVLAGAVVLMSGASANAGVYYWYGSLVPTEKDCAYVLKYKESQLRSQGYGIYGDGCAKKPNGMYLPSINYYSTTK